LYLARADFKPLVISGEKAGGQLMLTTEVENYPGFVEGIMGPKLMEDMRKQAEKFGAEMKYVGNLMWAAIFSEREIYECNVNRLMYRAGKIAEEFADKADLMDARGCNTNLKPDLLTWAGLTINAGVDDLMDLNSIGETLDKNDDLAGCGIWN